MEGGEGASEAGCRAGQACWRKSPCCARCAGRRPRGLLGPGPRAPIINTALYDYTTQHKATASAPSVARLLRAFSRSTAECGCTGKHSSTHILVMILVQTLSYCGHCTACLILTSAQICLLPLSLPHVAVALWEPVCCNSSSTSSLASLLISFQICSTGRSSVT